MMAGGLRVKARPMFDAASLGISCAIIEATDAGERNGGCAHRTRLQRYIKVAADQTFRLQGFSGLADGQHFGVSGHVIEFACAVARPRDDRALMNDDRTDGDFSTCACSSRFLERNLHGSGIILVQDLGPLAHACSISCVLSEISLASHGAICYCIILEIETDLRTDLYGVPVSGCLLPVLKGVR